MKAKICSMIRGMFVQGFTILLTPMIISLFSDIPYVQREFSLFGQLARWLFVLILLVVTLVLYKKVEWFVVGLLSFQSIVLVFFLIGIEFDQLILVYITAGLVIIWLIIEMIGPRKKER